MKTSSRAEAVVLPFQDNNSPDRNKISGTALKKALDVSLSMLGASAKQAVLEDLEWSGMVFTKKEKYSTDQVRQHMDRIFGHAAELIMERLRRELDRDERI